MATGVPGCAQIVAAARFTLNCTTWESMGSIRFALNLKGSGFDHVITAGRAERPMVLILDQGLVSLANAGELRGPDIFETTVAPSTAFELLALQNLGIRKKHNMIPLLCSHF